MSSIKTNFELPRGDNPVKQGQRLSQDLSSNFKAITKELEKVAKSVNNVGMSSFKDIFITGSGGATVVGTHDLGSTPTGWFIIDAQPASNTYYLASRSAWDSTTITYMITSSAPITLKIRVFI